MYERYCHVRDDIVLCYEELGDPSDPTVVLVAGMGMQLVSWPDGFCKKLARRGFHIVRFDNRDSGRSTHLTGRGPGWFELLRHSGRSAVYTIEDMAIDVAGLVRQLDLGAVHVVGMSLGGMIGQACAALYPDMVRSLASIMSSTGSYLRGWPAVRTWPLVMGRSGRAGEARLERALLLARAVGSRGVPQDIDWIADTAELCLARDPDPFGASRQLAAIFASGNRRRQLAAIDAPTVVIHGTDDRMVRPSGGRATARAIKGARLVMIDGMGHDLPRGVWTRLVGEITANARSAATPRRASRGTSPARVG